MEIGPVWVTRESVGEIQNTDSFLTGILFLHLEIACKSDDSVVTRVSVLHYVLTPP